MQAEALVALIGSGLALVGVLITGVMTRRASPYAVLAERVVTLEQKVGTQEQKISTQEREIDALKAHDRAHAVVLQTHAGWDARAIAALPAEIAQTLGPPPPLYPPETGG